LYITKTTEVHEYGMFLFLPHMMQHKSLAVTIEYLCTFVCYYDSQNLRKTLTLGHVEQHCLG